MFKYHCLNPISKVGTDKFSNNYVKTDNIQEADGILVRSAAMHNMELPKGLLAVARAGAGVNNIPLDKCASQGIVVFNTPGANANGVKELVIAAMLYASRDLIGGIKWVEANKDDANIAKTAEKEKKNFAGTEISGKKLGVIGLGAIGVLVANAATNLGMEVYGYDPFISVNAAWSLSGTVKHISNIEDIYRECDFISLHVPLLDTTKKMINADVISKMKPTAVVLNFARDLLVDEEAMVAALEEGRIKQYVTDFANPTVAGKKGCIITPHLGASTAESEDNCAKMAVKEVMEFLENGNIRNSVNYPNCEMGLRGEHTRITIMHRNVPNMIGQFSAILAEDGVNIANMTNKSRNSYAYTIIDVENDITDEIVDDLKKINDVLRVRIIN